MTNIPQKLYVQYMPDETAQDWLLVQQRALQQYTRTGRMVPIDELHITVLHFGFIDETFQQLLTLRPDLDVIEYRTAVGTFIETMKQLLPKRCSLTVERLDRFGPTGAVVALGCTPDAQLVKAYQDTMQQLAVCTKSLGLDDPLIIPSQPRALQVHASLTPHISLLKGVHDTFDTSALASTLQGQQLQVELFDLD